MSASGGSSGGVTVSGVDAGLLPKPIDPQANGLADLSQVTIAAFSQTGSSSQDPQVLDLAPDLTPRAWQRWDTSGLKTADYDFTYASACHAKNIRFVAGSTASVIFEDEVSPADFQDQVGRDAAGKPVPHTEVVPLAYRASLASPAYRQRLIDIGKIQIDGGADGVFFDEVNGGYHGANFQNFNGNEGFDDHDVADFGRYLCKRYGGSAAVSTFAGLGVTATDKLDCTASDPGSTFDYRGYIARQGATTDPLGGKNPLATAWGTTVANRPDPSKGTFVELYPALVYWQEIVLALRKYARQTYNKEILITSNGIFPFVDFQSVGLYDWNSDASGPRGFDAVPVVDKDPLCYQTAGKCQLDGTVSFLPTFAAFKARSKGLMEATAGKEVPVLVFLDWPTDNMNRYYALPLTQRQDYFRIYAAEASALGMWFAFPLATTTDSNTATALQMMPFFKALRAWYAAHGDIYRHVTTAPGTPTVSAPSAATALASLPGGKTVLHIINHQYSSASGVLPLANVTATFPLATAPSKVTLVSPDYPTDAVATPTYQNGILSVPIATLGAYVAVVAE